MITGAWGIQNRNRIVSLFWVLDITGARIEFGSHVWKQGRQIQFWPSLEFGGLK